MRPASRMPSNPGPMCSWVSAVTEPGSVLRGCLRIPFTLLGTEPAIRVNAALPVLRVAGKPAPTDNGKPGRSHVGAGLVAIRIAVGGPPLGRWGGALGFVHRGEGAASTDGLDRGQGRFSQEQGTSGPDFHELVLGQALRWSTLVDLRQYMASGRSTVPSKVLRTDGDRWLRLFEKHPAEGFGVMRRLAGVIAGRLKGSYQQLKEK